MYETTLHYAPCGVDGKGFKDVIILQGTNADITKNPNATGEDRLLTAENKWLIAHADANRLTCIQWTAGREYLCIVK